MSATIKAAITALKGRIAAAYSAISAKGGTLPATQDSDNLANAIATIPSGSVYTGHVDEVGLAAIGWTTEQINNLKQYICWNSSEDSFYAVPTDLINAYNQYIADNGAIDDTFVSTYKSEYWFRYCPNYNKTGTLYDFFKNAYYLVAVPWIEFSNSTNSIANAFNNCYLLVCVPYIKWTGESMTGGTPFGECRSLKYVKMDKMNNSQPFYPNCSIEKLEVINTYPYGATSLRAADGVQDLREVYIYAMKRGADLSFMTQIITKESLLYCINNETINNASSTIKLNKVSYNTWANDADVVAALANHTKLTLSY